MTNAFVILLSKITKDGVISSLNVAFLFNSDKSGKTSLCPVGWKPSMPMVGCWCPVASMCTLVSRCPIGAWPPLMTSTRAPRRRWPEAPPWSVSCWAQSPCCLQQKIQKWVKVGVWKLCVRERKPSAVSVVGFSPQWFFIYWLALIEHVLMRTGSVPGLLMSKPKYEPIHLVWALWAMRCWLLNILCQEVSKETDRLCSLFAIILYTLFM